MVMPLRLPKVGARGTPLSTPFMRGYRIAFSLVGPRPVPSDIFGDLRAYQQSSSASHRKSVSRHSVGDYRFGPITVDWADLGASSASNMSNPPSTSATANVVLGGCCGPSSHLPTVTVP